MAVPSFNLNLNELSDCDQTTGWSEGSLEPDIKKEGTNSLVTAIRNDATVTFTPAASVDMSATDTHLRLWFQYSFPATLDLKANGGIQLFVSDGTNTNAYYVGGSDTYEGGWVLLQADLAAPDVDGSADLSAITSCGFELINATAARNLDNTWWDYFVYGTGYEVYGGTSGDKITWDTIATADATNGYGVVQKINGVYFVSAELLIGDSVGTNNCYFDGSSEVVVFYDAGESATLYKINGSGNGTGTTDIVFDGTVIKSASNRFEFDMSGANVSACSVTGTTLANAALVDFKAGQTVTRTILGRQALTARCYGREERLSTIVLSNLAMKQSKSHKRRTRHSMR